MQKLTVFSPQVGTLHLLRSPTDGQCPTPSVRMLPTGTGTVGPFRRLASRPSVISLEALRLPWCAVLPLRIRASHTLILKSNKSTCFLRGRPCELALLRYISQLQAIATSTKWKKKTDDRTSSIWSWFYSTLQVRRAHQPHPCRCCSTLLFLPAAWRVYQFIPYRSTSYFVRSTNIGRN